MATSHVILRTYPSRQTYRAFVEQEEYEEDSAFQRWLLHQE